jgi:hypothetical protein
MTEWAAGRRCPSRHGREHRLHPFHVGRDGPSVILPTSELTEVWWGELAEAEFLMPDMFSVPSPNHFWSVLPAVKSRQDFRAGAVRLVRETGKPIAGGPGSGDQ